MSFAVQNTGNAGNCSTRTRLTRYRNEVELDIKIQDGFLWLWETDNVGTPTAVKGSAIVGVRQVGADKSQVWFNSTGPMPVFQVHHNATQILTAVADSYKQASRR